VSPKNLSATIVPFTSRSVSLAEDNLHKHLFVSTGLVPQNLLRMTTLLMRDNPGSSTSHHALRSVDAVCEKVLLFPSMALDAVKLTLLLNKED
jgi:hypothetical protein